MTPADLDSMLGIGAALAVRSVASGGTETGRARSGQAWPEAIEYATRRRVLATPRSLCRRYGSPVSPSG